MKISVKELVELVSGYESRIEDLETELKALKEEVQATRFRYSKERDEENIKRYEITNT